MKYPGNLFAEYAFSENADSRSRVQPKHEVRPTTGNLDFLETYT